MDIPAREVIAIIAQYLHDHQLAATLAALQEETGMVYEIPVDVGHLVMNGQWEQLLTAMKGPALRQDLLEEVFQQICLEKIAQGVGLNDKTITALMQRMESKPRKTLIEDAWHTARKLDLQTSRSQLAAKLTAELKQRSLRPSQPHKLLSLLGAKTSQPGFERTLPRGTEVTAACFFTDFLAVGRADGLIEKWNLSTGEAFGAELAVESHATCLYATAEELWAGCVDGSVYRWKQDRLVKVYKLHHSSITRIILHEDHLYTGDEAGLVKCTEAKTGKFVRDFHGHTVAITGLEYTDTLYSCSRDGTVRLGGAALPKIDANAVFPITAMQMEGDLLVAAEGSGIWKWRGDKWELISSVSDEIISMYGNTFLTRKSLQTPKAAVALPHEASGVCWSKEACFIWNEKGNTTLLYHH